MKQLTIGFSRASGIFEPFSWLIMAAQRTNYSHAYLKFHEDSIDRDIVFQASGLKVNFIGYSLFQQEEIVVKEFTIQISEDSYNTLIQKAVDLAGQPYSLLQILNTAIYMVCRKAPFDSQIIGWDCSKLVATLLKEELDYNITEDLDVISPKDLYEYLESKYGQN